jgi:hypothetical protein
MDNGRFVVAVCRNHVSEEVTLHSTLDGADAQAVAFFGRVLDVAGLDHTIQNVRLLEVARMDVVYDAYECEVDGETEVV